MTEEALSPQQSVLPRKDTERPDPALLAADLWKSRRICMQEKTMRETVFANRPQKLEAKLSEIDHVLFTLDTVINDLRAREPKAAVVGGMEPHPLQTTRPPLPRR